MVKLLKSSLLSQLAIGFVIGMVGILAFQPAEATHVLLTQVSAIAPFIG